MLPRSSLFSPYNLSFWLVGRGSKHLLGRPSIPPVLVVIMVNNKNKEIRALMDESFPAAAAATVRRTGGAGGASGFGSGGDSGGEKDFEQVGI